MRLCLHPGSLAPLALLAILLTGCATAQAATPDNPVGDIYTAAALTVSSAASSAAPTATLASSATSAVLPFTPTAIPTATATYRVIYSFASGCNNAAYISDVTVADGQQVAPGETFTKTWELRNTGSCAWSKRYSIVFVGGSDMQTSSADLDTAVAVGASGHVSAELTAPEDEGTFTGYWQLADATGTLFGQQVYVQIVVDDNAATLTPAPTATAESATPSSDSTPTAESATGTLAPTATTEFTLTPTPGGIPSAPTEALDARPIRS
jgi:hypothetical protein